MTAKTFFRDTPFGFILKNLIIAVIVLAAALLVLLFCLRRYTRHGEEIVVPAITGLYEEEASVVLAAEGLHMEVIDSTFSQKTPLGTIVEQNPVAGSKVKAGRNIYVIRNARFRRPVQLPALQDVSLRQAQATLQTLGIRVAKIQYEPSAYKDLVLDVQQNGTSLQSGTSIAEGSSVVLIVGRGKGTEKVTTPTLAGKTLTETRALLLTGMLTLGTVEYDVEPTDENRSQYIVYSQTPASGTIVVEGTGVNIKMTTDLEKTVAIDDTEDEEEFF